MKDQPFTFEQIHIEVAVRESRHFAAPIAGIMLFSPQLSA
jgi:hypothetical protein